MFEPVKEAEQIDKTGYLGYVEIDGVLNQGFVKSKDNKDYLYRLLDGTKVSAGENFMDYRCTLDSDNIIIYGHSSTKSKILFTVLMNYLDEQFAKKHSVIKLSVNGETEEYELFSVFLFSLVSSSRNDWMKIEFEREFLFEQAVKSLRQQSLHEFEPLNGEQMLTLVTCNTMNHEERLILVAMKKQDKIVLNQCYNDNKEISV